MRRRSEEHTSELQSLRHLVCRLLLEKKKIKAILISYLQMIVLESDFMPSLLVCCAAATVVAGLALTPISVRLTLTCCFFFLNNGAPPKFSPFPLPAPFRI